MQHLTDDAKTILLLCGRFGKTDTTDTTKPLSLREYNRLADWMVDRKFRPADLLDAITEDKLHDFNGAVDPERIRKLLSRGAAMALAVEKWTHSGIWVVCRSDDAYPERLKKHLKRTQAPPILYGVGTMDLLSKGGLAVVGSRNVDALGEVFTRDVGIMCAQDGMPIVSGGARGVDQVAMLAALDEGGTALGIVSDSLLKATVSGKYRSSIREKKLALVSAVHPEARFSVGNAMGRNKLIYALADFALVVSAEKDKGGTWTGAKEELKREESRRVFVRTGGDVPKGNWALIELGARPFPEPPWRDNIRSLLLHDQTPTTKKRAPSQASLFGEQAAEPDAGVSLRERQVPFDESARVESDLNQKEVPREELQPKTIYDAVLPVLLEAMQDWKTPAELTKILGIRKGQFEDWIKRVAEEGKAEKKTRPVRYRRK